jgi:hypothetical protein
VIYLYIYLSWILQGVELGVGVVLLAEEKSGMRDAGCGGKSEK